MLKDFNYIKILLHKTNRFHVAVRLFSNRSVIAIVSCATFLFLPYFDVICDLLLTDARQQGIYLLMSVWQTYFDIQKYCRAFSHQTIKNDAYKYKLRQSMSLLSLFSRVRLVNEITQPSKSSYWLSARQIVRHFEHSHMQKQKNSNWYWTVRDEGFKIPTVYNPIIEACKLEAIFNIVDRSATALFHDLNYSKESYQTQHILENHKIMQSFMRQ